MALDVGRLVKLRPLLLHITSRQNAEMIEREWCLRPAASILREAGMPGLVRVRRPEALVVNVGVRGVYLRDQRPLRAANVRLTGGWTFANLVEELNEHVFFWPAGAGGPSAYANRLQAKYAGQDQVAMAFRAEPLIRHNLDRLRVCVCNSGAPRCNPHVGKAERGPGTLAKPTVFAGTAGRIVEVAFRGEVTIANALEWVAPI